jgi:hypothetical protein
MHYTLYTIILSARVHFVYISFLFHFACILTPVNVENNTLLLLLLLPQKSAPGLDASGNVIPEKKLTYSDDPILGTKLPDLGSLQWFQGEKEALDALSSPKVKVVLFWAKFAKGDWHAIQQFEIMSKKYPGVDFLGISCDPSLDTAGGILDDANGGDYTDINLYKFKYTFPAAFDPDRKVNSAFRKQAGMSSMGAGWAFIVDKFQTIVWKEHIDMSPIASANQPAVCMHYWSHVIPDCQFLDQVSGLLIDSIDSLDQVSVCTPSSCNNWPLRSQIYTITTTLSHFLHLDPNHQLDSIINNRGSAKGPTGRNGMACSVLVDNGPRPLDDTAEEEIVGDMSSAGEDWGLLDGGDAFADEGTGDY